MWSVIGAVKIDELHCSEPYKVCLEGTEGSQRGGNYNSPVVKE